MAAEDYFGYDIEFQWYDKDWDGGGPPPPACEHCGDGDLEWRQLPSGKWRLWDADFEAWHKCPPEHDFAKMD